MGDTGIGDTYIVHVYNEKTGKYYEYSTSRSPRNCPLFIT
jgi:hypothetical protein